MSAGYDAIDVKIDTGVDFTGLEGVTVVELRRIMDNAKRECRMEMNTYKWKFVASVTKQINDLINESK